MHWEFVSPSKVFDPSTLPTCPGAEEVYTSRTGTIDYPDGNNRYQNNLNCKFTIEAQATQKIKFKFSEFDFEGNHVSQNYDWLKIYDAKMNKNIGEYAMGKYKKPPTNWKEIDSNLLFIHMKTDQLTRKKGFVMHWEFVSPSKVFDPSTLPTCPGAEEVYTSRTGTIDYPDGNNRYQNNLNCKFTIEAQATQKIKFKFSEFDFEGNHVSQNYDWLKIYDAKMNKNVGEYAMGKY